MEHLNTTEFVKLLLKRLEKRAVYTATILKVDKEKGLCDVEIEEGLEVYDVRLHTIEDAVSNKFLILPKEGSVVVCSTLNNDSKEAVVVGCSEIEEVLVMIGQMKLSITKDGFVFNGGSLGGLIDIAKLVQKVNRLENSFNTHTHVVPNGTSNVPSVPITPVTTQTELENTKIKHG